MDLVLVRHLTTGWNLAGKLQGRRDEDVLTPAADGDPRVRRNLQALDDGAGIDRVLASSLKRSQQTAVYYGMPGFQVEPLLDELDFGPFEGRSHADLVRHTDGEWREDPSPLVLGESVAMLRQRIERFLAKYQDHGRVLAFAHGAWMRGLISLARQGDLAAMNRIALPNNAMVTVRWPARTVVWPHDDET